MKRVLFMILALISCGASVAQRTVIDTPRYSSRNNPTHTIQSIELRDTATVVKIESRYLPNWGIMILPEAHLADPLSGKKYAIRSSEGIALGKKTVMPESNMLNITLNFEPVDKGTAKVDLMVDQNKGIYDIELTPHLSPIPASLQGNWYATDGSGSWMFGFFDDLAIYDNAMWHIRQAKSKGTFELINREHNTRRVTLYTRPSKNGEWMIGTSPRQMARYCSTSVKDPAYKMSENENEPWNPNRILAKGEALVRGYIKGYSPKLGFSKGRIQVNNDLNQTDRNFMIEIAPDGSFECRVEIQHPSELLIELNREYIVVHLSQGDTTTMYVEMDEMTRAKDGWRSSACKSIVCMGGSARYNNDVNEYLLSAPLYDSQAMFRKYGVSDFDRVSRDKLLNLQAYNKQYVASHVLTRRTIQYIDTYAILKFVMDRFYYKDQREYWIEKDKTITDKNTAIERSFYEVVNLLPLGDPMLLVQRDYHYLINCAEYFEGMRSEIYFPDLRLIENRSGVKFGTEVHSLIDSIKNNLVAITPQNEAYYSNRLDALVASDSVAPYMALSTVAGMNRVLEEKLGIGPCFTREVILSSRLQKQIKDSPERWGSRKMGFVMPYFRNDYIISSILQANDSKIAVRVDKGQQSSTPSTKDVASDDLLGNILKPYRGKVVFLDFWAMWCGPCRGGMQSSYRMKDVTKGKDIVFAYITTEKDSPKESREKFIRDNKIEGEFLIVTTDEWNELRVKYNFSGIPRYMLIDKQGVVVNSNARTFVGAIPREVAKLL